MEYNCCFYIYLSEEHGYAETEVLMVMAPAILVLASGYFFGGAMGDFFFKKTPKGGVLVSMVAVLIGAILLYFALNVDFANKLLFGRLLAITALFIPIASPNATSTVNDVTVSEIRSTAIAIQFFLYILISVSM
jgi:MFS transporter, Spinster family, sphingosine-1-phosphate transporter